MPRVRIFPPAPTIYPNDRQLFTAEATPPPALWVAVEDNGDIKSDFSLEVDAAGSQVAGTGGHVLASGIGAIEFTVDDQSRPTSTNLLALNCFITDIAGFLYTYTVNINSTTITVVNEVSATLFTTGHTLVSGDVFKVELSAGFVLFLNGVELHRRTNLGTTVAYPMAYRMFLAESTAAAPTRIPPPKLIGDWRLRPNLIWSSPPHGSFSTNGPGLTTEYFGGKIPGKYRLVVSMENTADAGNVQVADATITIPPLEILGDAAVTMQPGSKARFKTNYDAAQTKLVTWSVVSGGGSFTEDEFTAASTPGTTIVRATASVNGLSADITVTVPAVITNANNYLAAKPGEQIDFETNIPASTMPIFVSAGNANSATGNVTLSLPPGQSGDIKEGDLLLIVGESANETVAAPAGYNAVADSPQGIGAAGGAGANRLTLFYGRWAPGLTDPIITDPGDHFLGQILAFRGCPATGDPWDVTAGDTAATSTSVSIPGDTTTVNNCLIVAAVSNGIDTTTPQASGFVNASLSNLTVRSNFNTLNGVGGGFAVVTGGKATAGAVSATTATLASSSAQARIMIALKPGSVTWSASIGSINASSGVWDAPSDPGQTAKITVTNGIFTETIDVMVLEAFPVTRTATPVEGERRKRVLISESEEGQDVTRVKNRDGKSRQYYSVQIKLLTLTEFNTIMAFWEDHHPGKPFIWEDAQQGIRGVFKSDSDMAFREIGSGRFEVAFRIKEAVL